MVNLNFKIGTFKKSVSGSGEQTISGIGFKPGLLIFHSMATEIGQLQADRTTYFGFASNVKLENTPTDDTIEQVSFGIQGIDKATPTNIHTIFNSRAIWSDGTVADQFSQSAVIKRFTDDGFVIDWETNDTVNNIIGYIVIDSNANVGTFDTAAETRNQIVTGVGFKPSFVFLVSTTIPSETANANESTGIVISGYGGYSFGCANTLMEQAVTSHTSENSVTTTSTTRHQLTNRCVLIYDPDNPSTVLDEASFIRMNLDGFTINWNTATTPPKKVIYAAVEDCQTRIGTFTTPVSGLVPFTNHVIISGIVFTPRGLIFNSVGGI